VRLSRRRKVLEGMKAGRRKKRCRSNSEALRVGWLDEQRKKLYGEIDEGAMSVA
jgi:hypothetical protein